MSERAPRILSDIDRALYKKFVSKPGNEGITEDDFMEFREFALSRAQSSGMKNFFAVNGIIMEEKDLPSAEDIKDSHK